MQVEIEQRPLLELLDGDVLIRVQFSSLNYKGAWANLAVARQPTRTARRNLSQQGRRSTPAAWAAVWTL